MRHRAPFFLYLAIIVALGGSIAHFGWVRTWSSVFVPATGKAQTEHMFAGSLVEPRRPTKESLYLITEL
jgi:hypothetical protein